MNLIRDAAVAAVLALPIGCAAQESPEQDAAAVQEWVQTFYGGYAARAHEFRGEPAWVISVRESPTRFEDSLAELLIADAAAQSRSEDIVGLDWDPIVASQDPCERYEALAPTREGATYLVPIRAVCSGAPTEEPVVTAVLAKVNGTWLFHDFRYPDGEPLRQVLLRLKSERGEA